MSSKSWIWAIKTETSKRKCESRRKICTEHPLSKTVIVDKGKSKSTVNRASDPLCVFMEGDDPLSVFQRQLNQKNIEEWEDNESADTDGNSLDPWEKRRVTILTEHSTNEILTMTTYFSLQDKETSTLQLKVKDKPDDMEDGILYEINDIWAADFSKRMDNFHKEVIHAWNVDQRVKALKIVIQCSKLLNDTISASYYPSKFVLITDILDTFGHLVYTRLREKSLDTRKYIPISGSKKCADNFNSDNVPEVAKETCRNWFFKIASIRELIPRLYVEAALLKSCVFISRDPHVEMAKVLARLVRMVRGIGDPMVAAYARCYLCRMGTKAQVRFDYFRECQKEFLLTYDRVFTRNLHLRKKVELSKYLEAFTPALNWIMQGTVENSSVFDLDEIFEICGKKANNSLLLLTILTSFPIPYLVKRSEDLLKWMLEISNDAIPTSKFLEELGRIYRIAKRDDKSVITPALMNRVWNVIHRIQASDQYITCAESWIYISATHFDVEKIDVLIGDMVQHMSQDHAFETHYVQMENVLKGLIENFEDFPSLFLMENFLPFVNLFHTDSLKASICKAILEVFVKKTPDGQIGDCVIVNNATIIAKTLHDSINSLTVPDEIRQIDHLLSQFVRKIHFGGDYEQSLSFYVEARGAFCNLDGVCSTLVELVNRLMMDSLRLVKSHHTPESSIFARACAAYCFITIPSIQSELIRFRLYILSGQTALANQCLGQADACFNAAIDSIRDFPKNICVDGCNNKCTEAILINYLEEMLSILLVVPDNPCEEGVVPLLLSVINAVNQYEWENPPRVKCNFFVKCLHMLSVAANQPYPYHVQNVDSNDVLYGSNEAFLAELNKFSSVLLNKILLNIQELSKDELSQAKACLELFECIMLRSDVTNVESAKLAFKLWELARKSGREKDFMARTLNYYKGFEGNRESNVFTTLMSKLEI